MTLAELRDSATKPAEGVVLRKLGFGPQNGVKNTYYGRQKYRA
jgi:hypothetical protein